MGHRILKSRWPTKPFTIIYTPFILKFNLACTIIFKFFKQQKNIHFFTSTYGNSTKNYISTRANSNTLSAKEEWQQFNWTENYYRRYILPQTGKQSLCLLTVPHPFLMIVCSKKNAHRFSSKWQLFHISTNVLCSRCTTSLDYELALFSNDNIIQAWIFS